MKKLVSIMTLFGLCGALVLSGFNQTVAEEAETKEIDQAKYVFYFIGDGLGAAQRQLAEYYLQETEGTDNKLLINNLPNAAINTTHSLDTLITDSAAAGTALATGQKTNNGMISVLPDGTELKTLVELAEEKGMATGVATTTRVTHATPAVFISHNESRNDENGIAADYVDSGIAYLAGGGLRHFIPQGWTESFSDVTGLTIKSKRKDDQNIIQEFTDLGYKIGYGSKGAEEFYDYTPKAGDKYLALFAYSHMPYTLDAMNSDYKVPTLAEMTEKGIDLLSQDEDGFFFMIEAGRIDHACHPNDPAGAIQDTLALDDAVKEAYDFYLSHPEETLIVVVGDHETGGLGLGVNTDYFMTLEKLAGVTMSIEEFMYSDMAYKGDKDTFLKNVEQVFGLKDLTEKEMAMIDRGIAMQDAGEFDEGNAYQYDESAMAIVHILSTRAGVQWTSYAHTGTQIPLGAIGVGADQFEGFMDNTEIAELTAAILGTSF